MKVLLVISMGFLLPFAAICQNNASKVYMTADDFMSNKLSLSSTCHEHTKSPVKFKARTIITKDGEQKHKLEKGKVFGVKTCKSTFRTQKKW